MNQFAAATMETVAALACRETRDWTCRWENGSTATVQLRDGEWSLWGHTYHLRDETPISFVWSDGTVQTVEEWDGHTITWTTTNVAYPRIYWDAVAAPPSGSRAPSRTTQALRAPRPDLCACWIPCCPCICMPSLDGFLKPRMLSWQDEWPTPTPYPVLRERLDALGGDAVSGADAPLWTFHKVEEAENSTNGGDYPDVASRFAARPSAWRGGDPVDAEDAVAMDRTFAATSLTASDARDGVAKLNARMDAWNCESEGLFAVGCSPCTLCGSMTLAFWYDAMRAADLARAIDELNVEAAGIAVWGFAVVDGADEGTSEVAIALGARALPEFDASVATVAGVELHVDGVEAVGVEPDAAGIALSESASNCPPIVAGTVVAPGRPAVAGTALAPGATVAATPVVVGSVVRSASAVRRVLSRSLSDVSTRSR